MGQDQSALTNLLSFQMAPQTSIYQSPILEIFPLIKMAVAKCDETRSDIMFYKKLIMLDELIPFVSKAYIPVYEKDS